MLQKKNKKKKKKKKMRKEKKNNSCLFPQLDCPFYKEKNKHENIQWLGYLYY